MESITTLTYDTKENIKLVVCAGISLIPYSIIYIYIYN